MFIRPDTASNVRARLPSSNPSAPNASAPISDTTAIAPTTAVDRHAERQHAEPERHGDFRRQEHQPRQQLRQQVLALAHRARHHPLQQLPHPRLHDREADAPHAVAHEAHRRPCRESASRCSANPAPPPAPRARSTDPSAPPPASARRPPPAARCGSRRAPHRTGRSAESVGTTITWTSPSRRARCSPAGGTSRSVMPARVRERLPQASAGGPGRNADRHRLRAARRETPSP